MIKNFIIVGEMTSNEKALYWGKHKQWGYDWTENFDDAVKWTAEVLLLELPIGATGCMELNELDNK